MTLHPGLCVLCGQDLAGERVAVTAHAGALLFHRACTTRFAASLLTALHDERDGPPAPVPLRPLTPREVEVLDCLVAGCSNAEIARRLGINEKSARNHVSSILSKLHVRSRTQAAVLALRGGLR